MGGPAGWDYNRHLINGAPKARPPERSGVFWPRERRRRGVRGGGAPGVIKERTMPGARPYRFIVIALFLAAPALVAQVPSATDPAKYVLPPKNIVDVFDAEPLPQVLISPNRQ